MSFTTDPSHPPDVDDFWQHAAESYPNFPTVRHRRRFILNALAHCHFTSESTLFDYGCGEGTLLDEIKSRFGVAAQQLHGFDPSTRAIAEARGRLPGANLQSSRPTVGTYSMIICSEV